MSSISKAWPAVLLTNTKPVDKAELDAFDHLGRYVGKSGRGGKICEFARGVRQKRGL
jgi:hypothetical protein